MRFLLLLATVGCAAVAGDGSAVVYGEMVVPCEATSSGRTGWEMELPVGAIPYSLACPDSPDECASDAVHMRGSMSYARCFGADEALVSWVAPR